MLLHADLRHMAPLAPAPKRPRQLSVPQFRKGTPVLRPAPAAVRRQRVQLRISAELTDRGRRFRASEVEVKRIMGEGSYGQVFEVNCARKLQLRSQEPLFSPVCVRKQPPMHTST